MSSFAPGQPLHPGQQQYASGNANNQQPYHHPGAGAGAGVAAVAVASPQGQPPHSYASPASAGGVNRFAQNNASVISGVGGGGVYAPNPPAAYPGDIAQTQPMHHHHQQQQPYYEQAQAYRPQAATNPGYAPTPPNAAGADQQGTHYNAQYQGPAQHHSAAPVGQQYHVPQQQQQQQHTSPGPVTYAPPPGPPPSGSPLSVRQSQGQPPLQQQYQPPPHPPQQASPYGYAAQQSSPQPMVANPGTQYAGALAQGPAAAIGVSPTYHPPVSQGAQYHVHSNQSPVAQQQQIHRPYSPLHQQQQQQQQQPPPQQQLVHRPYSPVQRQHQYSPAHQSPQNQQYSPQPLPVQHQQQQVHPPPQMHPPPQQQQAPASANYAYSQVADPGYYRQEPVQLANPPTHPPYHPQQQQPPSQFQQQQQQQPQLQHQQQQPQPQQQVYHQTGYHQTPPPIQAQHSSYAGPNNYPPATGPMSASQPGPQYSAPNSAHTLVSPSSRPTSHYGAGPASQQASYLRQSPSPVPLSQSQMRRENAYRAGNGHYDMAQQQMQGSSGGGGFPEHRMSYIGGHTPISSVLTSEPILAPSGGLGSVSGSIHRPGGSSMHASGYSSMGTQQQQQQQQRYDASAQPPPPIVSQNSSMSTLVSSMGNLSMRPSQQTSTGVGYGYRQQQQQQQQHYQQQTQTQSHAQTQRQSLVMSLPAIGSHVQGSQATLNSGHAPKPPPVSLAQSSYVGASSSAMPLATNTIHSAPLAHSSALVHSASELPGSSNSPPNCNTAYPLWTNIHADGFHAYQHHIPVSKSNFSGTKHALIIGINYYNKEYSQTSNINSAHSFRNLLVKRFGYLEKNVVLLSDDQEDPRSHPTHHLITTSIKRMMHKVQPNDSVFFYFCGFGRLPMQALDRRGDAVAAIRRLRSDYILPSDFETAGAIDSAYLKKYLVRHLPQSARLTALFNCIVSDTGLGIPYKYANPSGTAVLTNAIAGGNLFEAGMSVNPASNASFGDLSQRFETNFMQQYPQAPMTTDAEAEEMARIRQSTGDIIVFGWDRDYTNPKHRSYLTHTPSNQLGAFWGAAMESALRSRPRATFADVLTYLQGSSKKIVMMPFIASGRKIRMDEEFDV
ncbi:Ca(2+)-dependent cysteine protease [Coemansia sp. RSA 2598]|nr:Ca(2+)-dependent cysteine protease [Coemansia sp. RSA 2598]